MPTIIVPTDFSPTSADAVRYGRYLADLTGYDLTVVHVHDGYDDEQGFVVRKGSARIRIRVRERLEKFVRERVAVTTLTEAADDRSDPAHTKCREVVGSVIPQLLKLSRREDTALIVMGGVGSGLPSLMKPVFGSVAQGVAARADCPVLLIPRNAGVPDIRRAAIAFDEVETLLAVNDSTAFLREVLDPAMHFAHVLYRDEESEGAMETELLHEMLEREFPNYAVDLDLLPAGDVATGLINYSLEREIDLLILARRPIGFPVSLFVRSEVPDIVSTGNIPMLIVPLEAWAPADFHGA